MTEAQASTKKHDRGARNLMILGVGAVLITLAATGLELWIYRASGDIYLDRSRPGFLPDSEEVEEETEANSNYIYSENGPLDKNELEEYLEELKKIEDNLKKIPNPYGDSALSDESLGFQKNNSDLGHAVTRDGLRYSRFL